MYEQMNIFDMTMRTYKIDKPVRLIELFAGIGSRAMALRDLGTDFEHYRAVEFDKYAVASYNAIHGTDFETTDIREIRGKDLGITDTENYCYIMTYSFPCQDLSVAGKQRGMTKGSGTRSGLLWEVERLIGECTKLPQILLMENVPQVHSEANMPDFKKWMDFLTGRGYSNYRQDLDAKDYGVAQSRKRCFMVSILGKWNYKFPHPVQLQRTIMDYLDEEVDERYYINNEKAQKLIHKLAGNVLGGGSHCGNEPKVCVDLSINNPVQKDVSNCITARDRGISDHHSVGTAVVEPINDMPDGTCRTIKSQYFKSSIQNFESQGSYGATGVKCNQYRIRKLTPKECWRLMGFSDEDFHKAEKVNSNTQLYKQAGNSIVKDVLMVIFGQMLQGENEKRVEDGACRARDLKSEKRGREKEVRNEDESNSKVSGK